MGYARVPAPTFGDKLPNGATVISATEHTDGVVLARTVGPQPWVTWRYDPGWPASTSGGHYFESLATAVEDYTRRGGTTLP